MLKTKSKILLALFLILVLVSSFCFATVEPRTSDEPIVTSEENVATISENDEVVTTTESNDVNWTNSDLYVCNDQVTISNLVDGNAFIIGKEVTISGEIGGDIFVLADKLNIEGGYIYSSIFACANEIRINGVVYDVYAACNTFYLESDGFVYRDMKVTASNVNMNGRVRRDAYISAENMNFREDVGAIIYGNLNYSSKSEITIPEGIVTGEVTYHKSNEATVHSVGDSILSYLSDLVKTLLFTFMITLILLWLTPNFLERVTNMSVAKSFISLGIGFATPLALILVSFLLILSMIGLPIFACGMLAFILLACIGFSITSIFFGRLFTRLLKMEGNVKFVLFTLISAIILWVIGQLPLIGGMLSFVISLFGIGATLVNMVWKKEKKEETK